MGRIASSVDHTMMESFRSTQRGLLDRRTWTSRAEPGSAIFVNGAIRRGLVGLAARIA